VVVVERGRASQGDLFDDDEELRVRSGARASLSSLDRGSNGGASTSGGRAGEVRESRGAGCCGLDGAGRWTHALDDDARTVGFCRSLKGGESSRAPRCLADAEAENAESRSVPGSRLASTFSNRSLPLAAALAQLSLQSVRNKSVQRSP